MLVPDVYAEVRRAREGDGAVGTGVRAHPGVQLHVPAQVARQRESIQADLAQEALVRLAHVCLKHAARGARRRAQLAREGRRDVPPSPHPPPPLLPSSSNFGSRGRREGRRVE